MRTLAPTLLLLAFCMGWAADEDSTNAVPEGQPVTTGGQVAADLKSQYDSFLTKYGVNPLSESLMDDMVKANSKDFMDIETAKAAAQSGGSIPENGVETTLSLPGGWASTSVTLGGTIRDIGGASAGYNRPPETVNFIGKGGPNRLDKLDKKMKRVSGFLNKHTCGGFDWGAQFNFLFKLEVLKEYVKQLGEGVVAAAPMALLGAFSPQLAEAVKHLKLIAGMDLSAGKLDCQQIQNALTGGLQKAGWSTNYSKCISDQQALGVKDAVKTCQDSTGASSWLANPDGTLAQTMNAGAATAGTWVGKQKDAAADWMGSMFDSNTSSSAQAASGQAAAAAAVGPAGNQNPNEQAVNQGLATPTTAEQAKFQGGIGQGVKSLANDLFGSFKFSATGGLEVGRKSIGLIDVSFKMHSVTLANKLTEQLDDHYLLLTAAAPDPAELQKSYRFLNTWTLRTRGVAKSGTPAWNSEPYNKLSTVKAVKVADKNGNGEQSYDPYKEQITHRTFDNLSVLRSWMGQYTDNPEMFAEYDTKYGVTKFTTALAKYELLMYVYEDVYKKAFNEFMTNSSSHGGAGAEGGAEAFKKKVQDMQAETEKDILTMIGHEQDTILTYLPLINRFEIMGLNGTGAGSSTTPLSAPAPHGAELPMGQ